MKKKKEALSRTIKNLERPIFLDIYVQFDKWLVSLGFRSAAYNERGTIYDYHYSHYNKHIDDMFGVEHRLHDTLKLSIYFLRDRNKHKIMFIGNVGSYSKTMSIEEAKESILLQVRTLRDEQLAKLSVLANI